MIDWAGLISRPNLKLAWARISTGRNLQHKRFFRHIYGGYELGLKENIDLLHEKLKGGWQATPPTRIYLPKSSGLLRPITLLAVEDQIVLQALANKVATTIGARRRKVELKQVFSNCLERSNDSIFFLQDWRRSYYLFQKQLQAHLKAGYTWIAHFDLAAFYETISHRALRSILAPRGGSHTAWSHIDEWLCVWSAGKSGVQIEHGIPQGPLASDFLAEAFLLPLDESMRGRGVKYIRYVDDIRVLAKTEIEARKGAVALELQCRKWSLIPQSSKFIVKEAKTLEDALGTLPSIVESARPSEDESTLEAPEAERIMRDALHGRPLRVVDKTRLRYVLYRASPSKKLLKWSLDLMPRHPEHVDAFVTFISQYTHSTFIIDRVQEMLRKGVLYEYVEGELWRLAASLGKPRDLRQLLRLFKKRSKVTGRTMPLDWGLLTFAAACARADVYPPSSATKRILSNDPYVQSLVIPFLSDEEYRHQGVIGKLLRSAAAEPGMAIVPRLLERGLSHRTFGVRPNDLAPQVRHALEGLGMLATTRKTKYDQIGNVLSSRFEIDYWPKWRHLFGSEYAHALSVLLSGEAKYDSDPSEWLSWQDSFNDALFRATQRHLARLGFTGACPLTNTYGELIDYGSLLDANKVFARTYPNLATSLRLTHVRRNQLPSSHPYEKKTAKRTRFLKARERNEITGRLATAFREVVALLDGHL